jgi:hypothetical protein
MIRFIRALRRSQTNSGGCDYFDIFDLMRMSLTVTIPSIFLGLETPGDRSRILE